jgi:hypothetical protein
MKKLRMEVETLAVESFAASAPRELAPEPLTKLPCSAIDACPSAWTCPIDPATTL